MYQRTLTSAPIATHAAVSVPQVNAMTVDVEDYFQVSAFATHVGVADWSGFACRVQRNTERILSLFREHDAHATFFVLGWIAERYPQLIRTIVDAGHEIASHGLQHERVTTQTPAEFRQDVTRSKALLEDVSGQPVHGYRAASFSIGAANLWALSVLKEAGYRYSSSIYPVRHDHYGMPQAPRFAFTLNDDAVLEIPITTVSIRGHHLPCGGGGYFRLLPYRLSRWALRRVNKHDAQPGIFYFHPWELDAEQPRMTGITLKTRFRHYLNLSKTEARLQRLLVDFRWDRMDRVFHLSLTPA